MNLLNISLLAPAALLGLLAVALPIYLHMRHKPRAEVYRFPAMDFLLKADKKRKRRFRVEQWLLMAFRIGIVCFLAFLFAKPYMDQQLNERGFQNNQPLVLIVDDSASMLAGGRGDRFFDEALARIGEVARSRSGGSPTHLIMASAPQAHAELTSADQVLGVLPRLRPTAHAVTLDEAYVEALNLIDRNGWQQASVQVYTDGSANAWQALPEQKPENVDVIYTDLRESRGDFVNVGIAEVSQSPGDANAVEVHVTNGHHEAQDVPVRVTGDGLATVSYRLRVEPHARATHRFDLGEQVPATIRVELADDDFDLDNRVVFAPKTNKRIRLLIVDGDTHPDPMRNESFFFKNALGFEESQKYGFDFEVVTPAGLTPARVEAVDVLCLLNVDTPNTDLLQAALAAGKGVFVSMGDRMVFERWNEFFGEYDLQTWEPKVLSPPEGVQIKDYSHPLFPPIRDTEWQSYLEGVAINKVRIMSVGRSNFEIPIARYDGSPLLLSKDLQPGRLMIWTSSMDLDWGSFPLEFGYVPFSRQLVAYLAGRESATGYQQMTTTDLARRGPDHGLVLQMTTDAVRTLDVQGPKPGVYTRSAGNGTDFVQVNLDPAEMDFRSLADPTNGVATAEALEELGFRSYVRRDLAPSVQWLLFLLIVVETLVAARMTLQWGAR